MKNLTATALAKTLIQGEPSVDEGGVCLYRGLNGLKCSIGHILPDTKYDPIMEGDVVYSFGHILFDTYGESNVIVDELSKAQIAHDSFSIGTPLSEDFVEHMNLAIEKHFSKEELDQVLKLVKELS